MTSFSHPEPVLVRDLLLSQFDLALALAAYHLDGLSTEECLWRPASRGLHVELNAMGLWRAEWPDTEGYDLGPPSIAWTTWHIVFWWRTVFHGLDGAAVPDPQTVDLPGTADGVRSEIKGLSERWRTVLRTEDLDVPRLGSWPLPEAPLARTAGWLNVELAKNAAEIGLVRFLHGAASQS
ncbi:MAG: DinB family protein [Nitrospiraceae bacterium]|nr:DinB family protein [Nitrospiraceae bacterium]